jgi:hypothetical protein
MHLARSRKTRQYPLPGFDSTGPEKRELMTGGADEAEGGETNTQSYRQYYG